MNKTFEPRQRIAADRRVVIAVSELESEQDKFKAALADLHPHLDPEGEAVKIQREIASATCAAQIAEATARLSKITAPAIAPAKQKAIGLASSAFRPLRAAALRVLDAAIEAASELVTEASDAETRLFAEFGLPRTKTPITNRVAEELTFLQGRRSAIIRAQNMPMASHTAPPHDGFQDLLDNFRQK